MRRFPNYDILKRYGFTGAISILTSNESFRTRCFDVIQPNYVLDRRSMLYSQIV